MGRFQVCTLLHTVDVCFEKSFSIAAADLVSSLRNTVEACRIATTDCPISSVTLFFELKYVGASWPRTAELQIGKEGVGAEQR